MNASQLISHWLHIAVTALGAWLVLHGSLSPSLASQVAQVVCGVVLALGASAVHSLRVWVDSKPQLGSLRGIVDTMDTIDTGIGGAQTTTTTTTVPATGKELFQEVAASIATHGTKP